jgi:hypothetical protein
MNKERALLFMMMLLILSGLTGCSVDAQGNLVAGTPGFGSASLYSQANFYDKAGVALGIKGRSTP